MIPNKALSRNKNSNLSEINGKHFSGSAIVLVLTVHSQKIALLQNRPFVSSRDRGMGISSCLLEAITQAEQELHEKLLACRGRRCCFTMPNLNATPPLERPFLGRCERVLRFMGREVQGR